MSVLIKGMEMPTSCSVCPLLEGDRMDGLCHAASRWLDDDEYWTWYVYSEGDVDDSKPCNCPLVPVQAHGRLGDLDALAQQIEHERFHHSHTDGLAARHHVAEYGHFLEAISDAPTIIPAEEGET